MRVLFTSWAWPSHLYALVPLASAYRAAGHEVLVAGPPALKPGTDRTGLPGAVVGTDTDAAGMVRGYVLPSTALGPSAPPSGGEPLPGNNAPRALRMVAALAASMTDGLVELARDWRADLVVYEPTALAGPVAAAAAGVPAVRVLYGTDLLARARALLPQAVAPFLERYGIEDFDALGTLTVDPCPDALQLPVEYRRMPVQYVPYNGCGEAPRPPLPDTPPGVRRALVTWGHTMARLDSRLFLGGQAAAALAGPGVEVVLAVSARQRDLLGPELLDGSAGVRVVTDVPLHALVPSADLVVAHGGAGTVLTSLRAGVPLLLVPQLPDHKGHAGRVAAVGAGRALARDEATTERLRSEAYALLDDDAAPAAARRMSADMLARPTPAQVAAELSRVLPVRAAGSR
ncbi:nucleotide disphospho-sugar-binding domain-containing protein [Streptomyces chrestomyceticus]|uniref:nucleotide disphospho-sugar-binding domain-containing protein n=1 Tax=Streptomyces chrestomyceticus TaxID=68185 RepID=UPI0033E73FD5